MTEPTQATTAPRNRMPVILGAGLAAVVLILVLTRFVGGGGDDEETSETTRTTTSTVVGSTTTTVAGAAGAAAPVETFEVFSSKNPFLPLRTVGGATAGGTSTGGTTTGGTTTGGTSTGTGTGTGTGTSTGGTTTSGGTSTGTSTSTSGGTTEPRRSDRVTLLDVFVESGKTVANVKVNDTVYKVAAGDTFATSYKVLSLSQADDCGRFTFGDDAFRLCRGEQALK